MERRRRLWKSKTVRLIHMVRLIWISPCIIRQAAVPAPAVAVVPAVVLLLQLQKRNRQTMVTEYGDILLP